jgi:hypothetical protein
VRRATICFVFLAFTAQGVTAQSLSPLPGQSSSPTGVPQAPVGHRQPTAADLPASVLKDEQPGAKPWPSSQSQTETKSDTKTSKSETSKSAIDKSATDKSATDKSATKASKSATKTETRRQAKSEAQSRSRSRSARGSGGGPPVLQVGPSCEAAGRGAVVLGRNKESCLADETAAQTTLKQNWTKYAAGDKTLCIGMESTGGPASYVELLSCLEINRDAREIQNADPLEADLSKPSTTGAASADSQRHRRRR